MDLDNLHPTGRCRQIVALNRIRLATIAFVILVIALVALKLFNAPVSGLVLTGLSHWGKADSAYTFCDWLGWSDCIDLHFKTLN